MRLTVDAGLREANDRGHECLVLPDRAGWYFPDDPSLEEIPS